MRTENRNNFKRAGSYKNSPLHLRGTPDILQAFGSDKARVRLTGIGRAEVAPFAIWHIQSVPPLRIDASEVQQPAVGEPPVELLLVT